MIGLPSQTACRMFDCIVGLSRRLRRRGHVLLVLRFQSFAVIARVALVSQCGLVTLFLFFDTVWNLVLFFHLLVVVLLALVLHYC